MAADSKTLFTKYSPTRLFFTAAIPGMISMMAASLYSIVEGAFIGQYIGGASFAAQNLAMPLIMINFALADLVGVGSSVQISIALGKKDEKRANGLFSVSLIMIVFFALLMGAFMFFASPTLLGWMGARGETAMLAVRYLRVYALASPICTATFAMDNYLRICGFIKSSMFLNIFMSLFNIVLLALLIGVFRMDITGAAIAGSVAMSVCALIAFVPFLLKKTQLRFARPDFSFSSIKNIITCGLPTFLNNIAGRLAAIVMNIALLAVGGDLAVSAYGVLMYASDFVMPLLYGMNDSLQPAIGYNWGAGDKKRVRSIAKRVFSASGIVSALATVLLFIFSREAASVFVNGTEQPELLTLASGALKLHCISILFRWFGFSSQCFYSAIEKPLPASILSVASALVFPLLTLALLWPLGLDGLWLNTVGVALFTSILALFMMKKTWRGMKKEEALARKICFEEEMT